MDLKSYCVENCRFSLFVSMNRMFWSRYIESRYNEYEIITDAIPKVIQRREVEGKSHDSRNSCSNPWELQETIPKDMSINGMAKMY